MRHKKIKQQEQDKLLRMIVVMSISIVYIIGTVISIIYPDRHLDANIGILMGAIVGYLLKPQKKL